MRQLQDKVAVVTGGVSGIGLATVELFVAEGAFVAVGDIQDEAGEALAARFFGKVIYVHTDIADDAAIERLVLAAVNRFGKLDIMFNNAGAAGDQAPIIDLAPEGLARTMAILTGSVVSGHKYAARQFLKQGTGGVVISTASTAGIQGGWANAAYTIAKHGVLGVMRQAVAELGRFGIRSNSICPGIIMTPILARSVGVPPEQFIDFLQCISARLGQSQPSGRVGQPEDIARVALFLASDASAYVNGVALPVDGGATAISMDNFAAAFGAAVTEYRARDR